MMFQKNLAQEEAVQTHNGPVLLVSCPGSGKTTTMLRRINSMITSGIQASSIVMVTFTDAAAQEMKARYIKEYGECCVAFCTIHSMCLRILKEYSDVPVNVIPAEIQYGLLRQCFRKIRVPYRNAEMLKGAFTDISACANSGYEPSMFHPASVDKNIFPALFAAYQEAKREAGYLDFDDMLCVCRDLLRSNSTVLTTLQKRYSYLLCDEYQDTNLVQKDILYMLAGDTANLCVVGDDDQSIYGFRGATPGIMLDFEKDFPNAKIISMDTNYRSRPEIIGKARNLIGHNKERFEKNIKAARDGHGDVIVKTLKIRSEELSWIAAKVKSMISDGISARDIAVLARTNLQLEDLACAFDILQIPYTAGESIHDDYEHFIFRDLISYLTLMEGNWDKECFLRILNRPVRWLKESLFSTLDGFDEKAMLQLATLHKPYEKRAVEEVRQLYKILCGSRQCPLVDKIKIICNECCYRAFLCDYADSIGMEPSVFFSKLDFFLREAVKYRSVSEWMEAAKRHVAAHRRKLSEKDDNAVTLATMHRSKGLEWDHVFILDCCQNIMPGKNPATAQDKNGSEKSASEIEEERRLFYVAMTRARESLYLCNYAYREKKIRQSGENPGFTGVAPSIFLAEMQEDLEAKKKKIELDEKNRKESVCAVHDAFLEGSPATFATGMEVHHPEFGTGTVIRKTPAFVIINFGNESKMFFLNL